LDDDMRRRRIRVRAWRRGMREMDILMGRFVDARIEALPAAALAELEALLDLPDDAVYRWLSGAEQPPAEHDTPLLRQIIDFHRHDGPIH
jgi:antitoxin CptB